MTSSCVTEIKPKTLTWNMDSKSASAMSPIFSTPSTNPALFTAARSEPAQDVADARIGLTEDVDLAQLRRDAVPEGGDLLLVRDVELHGGELAAGLDAGLLVCGGARVGDLLELLCAPRLRPAVVQRVCFSLLLDVRGSAPKTASNRQSSPAPQSCPAVKPLDDV